MLLLHPSFADHLFSGTTQSWKTGTEWNCHNPRRNGHQPARHAYIYGARWDPPKCTEGAVGRAHWDIFHHSPPVLAHKGGLSWLKISQRDPLLQERLDGGSQKLKAHQLGARSTWVPSHGMDRIAPVPWECITKQLIKVCS